MARCYKLTVNSYFKYLRPGKIFNYKAAVGVSHTCYQIFLFTFLTLKNTFHKLESVFLPSYVTQSVYLSIVTPTPGCAFPLLGLDGGYQAMCPLCWTQDERGNISFLPLPSLATLSLNVFLWFPHLLNELHTKTENSMKTLLTVTKEQEIK